MQAQNIMDIVFSNPVALLALTVTILVVLAYQRTLSYREYRLAHGVKTALFVVADDWARRRGRPLLREKAPAQQSAEYVLSRAQSPRAVFDRLRNAGFSPHLLATTKARTEDGQRQYTAAQLVYIHDDGKQTEAYLFETVNGTDVYAHVETAVYDPEGHVTDRQQAGDVRGVVRDALTE